MLWRTRNERFNLKPNVASGNGSGNQLFVSDATGENRVRVDVWAGGKTFTAGYCETGY